MTNAQREIIRQAVGSLGAAIAQSLPSDDQIIMDHVRESHASLRTLFFVETEEKRRRNKMKAFPKRYIGDGAYVECDGYGLILTTEDGIRTTNTVVINMGDIQELKRALNDTLCVAEERPDDTPDDERADDTPKRERTQEEDYR